MPTGIYNRTKTVSLETRKKISERMKGGNKGSFKKGNIPPHKGKKIWSDKTHPRGMLGKKASEETKLKMSIKAKERGAMPPHPSRESHWNWQGGITALNYQIRHCFKYRQWRSDNFTRDDYTCQDCGQRGGGEMHVDHTKMFSVILKENNIKSLDEALNCEELWNINNGRTLCRECHRKTDTYGYNNRKKR